MPSKPKRPVSKRKPSPAAKAGGDADTRYTLYLLLARTGARPLYAWETWQRAVPLLDGLVDAARGNTAIWVTGKFGGGEYGDFGKIAWDARGHQRWPAGAPLAPPESQTGKFNAFKLWKPPWATCRKEGVGPDLFIELWNATSHGIPGCDYGFLLAASENLSPAARHAAGDAARGIAGLIDLTLAATAESPWARRKPGAAKARPEHTLVFALGEVFRTLAPFATGVTPPTPAALGGEWEPFA